MSQNTVKIQQSKHIHVYIDTKTHGCSATNTLAKLTGISWKTGLTSRWTKGQDSTTTIQMIANKKTNKPDAAILTANNSILPRGVDVHVIQSSLPHYVMSTRELRSLLCLF